MNSHPHSTHQSAVHVMAAGRSFLQRELVGRWQESEVQKAFESARARFGHVLCMCRAEPLKLQIRLRDGHFHLAVWPQEGPRHDTECAYFRDELSEAQGSSPAPAQTRERTQADDSHQRTEYVLGQLDGVQGKGMSIRSFAVRLWERASLCRWHPSWTRDWGRTRYQLMLAAGEIAVNGIPCEEILFVPKPYREAVQATLNSHWEQFVRSLAVERPNIRLLIAPLRRFTEATEDRAGVVYLRHLRSPIGLSPACHDYLQRECRNVLRSLRLQADCKPGSPAAQISPEVIGVFIVESSSRGGVWARAGWLIPVHPRAFIPAPNPETVTLIDRLISDGHAFQHLPSEVPASRRMNPDWLVRHVLDPHGRPVARAALEILDRGCGAEFIEARAALARRMLDAGIPTWTWVPSGPRSTRVVPPLPPSDQRPGSTVHAELRQIQASPVADYRFGPSTKFTLTERKTA